MAVSNKIIVDKDLKVFEIVTGSDYPSADVSQTVNGVYKLSIDTGSGYLVYYLNGDFATPNYQVNIDGAGVPQPVANTLKVSIPTDSNGVMVKGFYKFEFTEQFLVSALPVTQTQTVTFQYITDVDVSTNLKSSVSYLNPPIIKVYDESTFQFNGVTPTFELSALTLYYPETALQPPLTVTTVPFNLVTNNVWTLGYNAVETIVALYEFVEYSERIKRQSEISFIVDYTTLCQVFPCMENYKYEMDAAKATNYQKYSVMKETYNYMMSLASMAMTASSCGGDASLYASEINDLINASSCATTCNCDGCDNEKSVMVTGSTGNPFVFQYAYIGIGGTVPTNSLEVLALTQTLINNDFLQLNTGTTESLFVVCLPPSKTITSVIDVTNMNIDLTAYYVFQGTVPVTIDGVAYNYNIYAYDPASPYAVSAIHKIYTT